MPKRPCPKDGSRITVTRRFFIVVIVESWKTEYPRLRTPRTSASMMKWATSLTIIITMQNAKERQIHTIRPPIRYCTRFLIQEELWGQGGTHFGNQDGTIWEKRG